VEQLGNALKLAESTATMGFAHRRAGNLDQAAR
jgi:hypothetical protein